MPSKNYLFNVAVVQMFPNAKDEAGNITTPDSIILVPPTTILAVDEDSARLETARMIPDGVDLSRCMIHVSTFGGRY